MASLVQAFPALRGAVTSAASTAELLVRCTRCAPRAIHSAVAGVPHGLAVIQRRGNFEVGHDRLEDFLHAEKQFLSQRPVTPVRLQQIVHVTEPLEVAKLVHEELPPRFAQRMIFIESIDEWQEIPMLVNLHEIFWQSFRDLRLVELNDLDAFDEVIRALRRRHKPIVPMLSQAIRHMYDEGYLQERQLNQWVDAFMGSRISTEMLTSHFVACIESAKRNAPMSESWWGPILEAPAQPSGIVQRDCDPAYICQEVANAVSETFETPYSPAKVRIEVKRIPDYKHIEFSYVSKYLYFVVEELLKNCARAVADKVTSAEELESTVIKVVVCADEQNVAIRISDTGGGMPLNGTDKIWSYVFSTAPRPPYLPIQVLREQTSSGTSPLTGWGMGLPLSRLYVRYLGGSLELRNMPGIGVDLYMFLKRIDCDASKDVEDVEEDSSE